MLSWAAGVSKQINIIYVYVFDVRIGSDATVGNVVHVWYKVRSSPGVGYRGVGWVASSRLSATIGFPIVPDSARNDAPVASVCFVCLQQCLRV